MFIFHPLRRLQKVLIVIRVLALVSGIAAYFLPWWRISLETEYTCYGTISSGVYYTCYAGTNCNIISGEASAVDPSIQVATALVLLGTVLSSHFSQSERIQIF